VCNFSICCRLIYIEHSETFDLLFGLRCSSVVVVVVFGIVVAVVVAVVVTLGHTFIG